MHQFFIWTLGDVITLALAVLIIVVGMFVTVRLWIVRSRCKHDSGVNETQACDAICRKCGKNLGFIGLRPK